MIREQKYLIITRIIMIISIKIKVTVIMIVLIIIRIIHGSITVLSSH